MPIDLQPCVDQSPSVGDYRTDWNGRYQSIVRRINDLWSADIADDTIAEMARAEAQNDLIHLTQDFLFFVRHYGMFFPLLLSFYLAWLFLPLFVLQP